MSDNPIFDPDTPDDLIPGMVAELDETELDLVADNEERLLRAPLIVAALYMNPRTRMSTTTRVVQVAARNQLVDPGVPRWTDVVASVTSLPVDPPERDAAFAAMVLQPERVDVLALALEEDLDVVNEREDRLVRDFKKAHPIDKISRFAKIRLATLGNALVRTTLIRDSDTVVAVAAIHAPAMTENEVIKHSANGSLAYEVIAVIAATKEWTRLYTVKMNLVNNPRCPLTVWMKLLPLLHAR